MIEQLAESTKGAFGFKVTGTLAAEDIASISKELEASIATSGMPIGLLIDLSEMHGATWSARWEEMRFLQTHSTHIARLAVISNDEWEDIKEQVLLATTALQAVTQYFLSTETVHAWHWAKYGEPGEGMPVRVMYPGTGLFGDYTPEYMGV